VSHPTNFPPPGPPVPWDEPPEPIVYPATDLRAHGADVSVEKLFTRLSATMCQRIAQWDRGAGLPAILTDWIRHARGIGERITIRNEFDGETSGRFAGLDETGRLLLELPDGTTKKIAAGDVFLFHVRGGRTVP
jgi:BirA family biotin operon repressor/biotin-[acetyl-CoA-carboxylase] ligase